MPSPDLLKDHRVSVAVSMDMEHLRATQRFLNYFLWSTELAYGHVLAHGPDSFGDPQQLAADALSNIAAEAWYPSSQGRIRYRETVESFLAHIRSNTTNVCRAVLVFFCSAFEDYLDRRVRPLLSTDPGRNWGPFYKSLAIHQLTKSPYAPRLASVLRADLSRLIRNRIVHPPFQPPTNLKDPWIKKWRSEVTTGKWASLWGEPVAAMNSACDNVFKHAAYEIDRAKDNGKELPVDFFLALYTFANLDGFAFEIEEALIPSGGRPAGRIMRHPDGIRRDQLVIGETPNNAMEPAAPA